MNELIMLVGLPASGKTFMANEFKNKGYIVHSSDDLRKELFGDENVQDKNETLFQVLHGRIKNDLVLNKNVVYDATNISYKKRMAFLNEISKINCSKKCLIMATPVWICLKNNRERDRVVPNDVIINMWEHFDFPSYFEGWNDIDFCSNFKDESYLDFESLNKTLLEFDQDNPHHSLTLGQHLIKAKEYAESQYYDCDVILAAELHDIGKLYTKSYTNKKGEKTDIAHYHNHEKVSAYEAMLFLVHDSHDYDKDYIVDICTLIRWHMQFYFNELESTKRKWRIKWGNRLYDKLEALHESDVYAH